MELAVRSYLATGVAIAGVGALAVSPLAPMTPDLKAQLSHSSAAVELSALVNPIEEFSEVFGTTFQNLVAIGQQIADNPAPIATQIVKNQLAGAAAVGTFAQVFGESLVSALAEAPEQFQVAVGQFSEGQVKEALNTVVNAVLSPVVNGVVNTLLFNPEIWAGLQNAIRQPIANALAVVDLLATPQVYNLLAPLLAPVQLISDVTNAVGDAGDGIFAGVKTGNLETVANAVLSFGPNVTQAVLNGNAVTPDFAAGLFGGQGIVRGLLTIRDLVAAAITPPASSSVLKVASADIAEPAATVTLDVAPQTKAIGASKTDVGTSGTAVSGTVSTGAASSTTENSGTVAPEVTPVKDTTTETTTDTATTDTATTDTATTDTATTETGTKADSGAKATTTKKADRVKNVRTAVKKIGKNIKDAISGLKAKPAKPARSEGAKSGSDSAGGSSSAGSSSGSSE